jgi:uncharacterized membrane protein
MKKHTMLIFATGLITGISCNKSDVTPTGAYFPQVKKIINANCIACHYQGGQGMPVILTSDSDIVLQAAAIKAATCDTSTWFIKRMPPGGELSDSDKTIITNWLEKGGGSSD